MSTIPRAVREQIEALLAGAEARKRVGAENPFALGQRTMLTRVLAILDAADREHEDARRAHFENDDVP